MAGEKKKVAELLHPQLTNSNTSRAEIDIVGYLGRGDGTKLRIYQSLEDRSRYVEFEEKDAKDVAEERDGRVSVSLDPDSVVRTVYAETISEARFLGGAVNATYMAPAVEYQGGVRPDIHASYSPCNPTYAVTCYQTCYQTHYLGCGAKPDIHASYSPCNPTYAVTCYQTCYQTHHLGCGAKPDIHASYSPCNPTYAVTCYQTCYQTHHLGCG